MLIKILLNSTWRAQNLETDYSKGQFGMKRKLFHMKTNGKKEVYTVHCFTLFSFHPPKKKIIPKSNIQSLLNVECAKS